MATTPYNGRPCKRGHKAPRDSQGACTECRRIYEKRSYHLYCSTQRNARTRGIPFSLTKDFAAHLHSMPCHWCGSEGGGSIDRVDNSVGYEEGNCVSACWTCNSAKKEMSESEFLSWIKQAYMHNLNKLTGLP